MRLYLWLGVAVLALTLFEAWVQSQPVLEERRETLGELRTRQLESWLESTRLLTTLATAVIGAAAGALINRAPGTVAARRRAIMAMIFAASSVYCGHLATRNVVWMLHSGFFNLYYAGIDWPGRLQFWLFLLSVVVLADFVYRSMPEATR